MKKSEVLFSITTDSRNVCQAITWSATNPDSGEQPALALNLATWDPTTRGTMNLNVWAADMPAAELKRFYVDQIAALAESLVKATDDQAMADQITDLCSVLLSQINAPKAE